MKLIRPKIDEFLFFNSIETRQQLAERFSVSLSSIDRWKKEFNSPKKTFKYKELPPLTEKQLNIVVGSMLGDGCLQSVGRHNRVNSLFTETHSEKQYGLIEWKFNQLNPFSCNLDTKIVNGRKNINGKIISDPNKKLLSCKFQTVVHPVFTQLEKKWYLRDIDNNYVLNKSNRRIKIIPNDLVLNEEIVSVWYYDDGSNNQTNRQATFNTHNFSKTDCEQLIDKLKKIGINCGIAKNREQFVVITKSSSYLDLIEMAKKFLPSKCVEYKIDLSKYKSPDYSTRFKAD